MPPLFKPSQLVKASNRSSDVRVRASSKRSNNGISFSTWIFLSLLSCLYSNAFAYISEVNPIDASARNGLPTNKRALPKKSRTAQPCMVKFYVMSVFELICTRAYSSCIAES